MYTTRTSINLSYNYGSEIEIYISRMYCRAFYRTHKDIIIKINYLGGSLTVCIGVLASLVLQVVF